MEFDKKNPWWFLLGFNNNYGLSLDPKVIVEVVPKTRSSLEIPFLGGETSNIVYFHPELWGKDPTLTIIFFKEVGSTTN